MITVYVKTKSASKQRFDIPAWHPEEARQVLLNYWADSDAENLAVLQAEYCVIPQDAGVGFRFAYDRGLVEVAAAEQSGCVHSVDPGCTVRDFYCARCGENVCRSQCGNAALASSLISDHRCEEAA